MTSKERKQDRIGSAGLPTSRKGSSHEAAKQKEPSTNQMKTGTTSSAPVEARQTWPISASRKRVSFADSSWRRVDLEMKKREVGLSGVSTSHWLASSMRPNLSSSSRVTKIPVRAGAIHTDHTDLPNVHRRKSITTFVNSTPCGCQHEDYADCSGRRPHRWNCPRRTDVNKEMRGRLRRKYDKRY